MRRNTRWRSPYALKLDRFLSGRLGRQILVYFVFVITIFLILFGIAYLLRIPLGTKGENFWTMLSFFYQGVDGALPENRGFAYIVNFFGAILLGGILIAAITNFLLSNRDKAEKGLLRYRLSGHSVFIGYHDSMIPLIRSVITQNRYAVILSELPFAETKDQVVSRLRSDDLNKQIDLKKQINDCIKKIKSVKEKISGEKDEETLKYFEKDLKKFEQELEKHEQEFETLENKFKELEKAIDSRLIVYHGQRTDFEDLESLRINDANEVYIFPDPSVSDTDSTNLEVVEQISLLCEGRVPKLKCTTLFQQNAVVTCFERSDINDQIKKSLDFSPVIYGDAIARALLSGEVYKNETYYSWHLDRDGIYENSDDRVHFFIIGLGEIGQALFAEAVRQLHFPNFNRTKSTITLVGEQADIDSIKRRYREFFAVMDNSPLFSYLGDFLDISVQTIPIECTQDLDLALNCAIDDPNEIVTVAVCLEHSAEALKQAISLPRCVFDNRESVQVWLYKPDSDSLAKLIGKEKDSFYSNIILFGEPDKLFGSQDVQKLSKRDLIRAQRVNYVYKNGKNPQDLPSGDEWEKTWVRGDKGWDSLSFRKKLSNYNCAYSIPVRMRSLGFNDINEFYISDEQLDTFSRVEHNRWVAENLIGGFRPPFYEERENMRKDRNLKEQNKDRLIHLDLCSSDDLLTNAEGIDVREYDKAIVKNIPLILQEIVENE